MKKEAKAPPRAGIEAFDPMSLTVLRSPDVPERYFAAHRETSERVEISREQAALLYQRWENMMALALRRRAQALYDLILYGQSFREADMWDGPVPDCEESN